MTQNDSKGEYQFLHMTYNLDPIYIYVYQISIKLSQRLQELLSAQDSSDKVHSREITQNGSKREQLLLHMTHRLDSIYMYTNYH